MKQLPRVRLRFSPRLLEFQGESTSYHVSLEYSLDTQVCFRYHGTDYLFVYDDRGFVRKQSGDARISDELYAMFVAFAEMQMKSVFKGYKIQQARRAATKLLEAERQMRGGLPTRVRTKSKKKVPVHPSQQRLL